MKRILFTRLSPGSHKNAKRWEWRYGEEEDGRWHGDEEEESRQAAIIRRNWHRCSRWDADLIYLSRLSGILILVRGRAFSNDASSAPSSSPLSLSLLVAPAASSSSWTARGEARIACELVVSRWGFEALAALLLPLPSSFPPRFHPARKEVNEDDIKVIRQYNQVSSFLTSPSSSRHIFLNSRYFRFSPGWFLRIVFLRLIFFFYFFLNRNNLHPNSFRWQRLIGFFLNRSSFEL